jgi:hypothetical protein
MKHFIIEVAVIALGVIIAELIIIKWGPAQPVVSSQ